MAASYDSIRATELAAIALGGVAVAIWATRTARPGADAPAEPGPAPRLPAGAAEVGGLVAVVLAAAGNLAASPVTGSLYADWLTVLGLVLAAALRGYRLARPGPRVLDHLGAVLALVPAFALLAAAVSLLLDHNLTVSPVYAVAGGLALAAGLRWRRLAGA
ncbi:hypothetical protein [Dactylosporangium sp. NPDC049140]|uniref:hypothetical protein n=1 Tax=Dactylosporangium sp. NPDC049140 TaxID=3155647 RepID=UPI0033BFC10A